MSSGDEPDNMPRLSPPTSAFFLVESPKLTMPQEERRGVKTGNLE